MSINLAMLKLALKESGYKHFRDKAKKNTKYPYIVYTFISKDKKNASSKPFRQMPLYQVSLFTAGTEEDLIPLEKALDKYSIPYAGFVGIPGDENDETITNFYTRIRVIDDGQ